MMVTGAMSRRSWTKSGSLAALRRPPAYTSVNLTRINRHSENSATAQKELTAKRSGIASIRDVEETATSLWVHVQLNRIRKLLVEHGADDEMLDAVDYLAEDNKGWIDPEIAAALGSAGIREA